MMSLFGSLLGDVEDDPFMSSHVRQMRQMSSMMSNFFGGDPFGMFRPPEFDSHALTLANSHMNNPLMSFGFPAMPNFNRLLSGSLDSLNSLNSLNHHHHHHGSYSSSSTVVSMTAGPDGRPQVYKATSSTRVAPGGVKETQRTEQDSRTGTKKMAIGHHIGDRAHIIEREQNLHSGDQEERQDFINIEEDDADEFNKEWETKTRSRSELPRVLGVPQGYSRHSYAGHGRELPAITAGPSTRRHRERRSSSSLVSPRRSIRSSPLTLTSCPPAPSSSAGRRPYSPPQPQQPRKSKNIKTVSGSPAPPDL